MPDTVRRALRTFAQAFLGALVLMLPTDLALSAAPYLEALAAAGYAAVVAMITWAQNELEDAGRLKDRR